MIIIFGRFFLEARLMKIPAQIITEAIPIKNKLLLNLLDAAISNYLFLVSAVRNFE